MADSSVTSGRLGGAALAFGLTVLAIFVAELMTLPAILADPTLLESPADAARWSVAALMILNFLGFVVVGALYLSVSDRGWSFVDLRRPTLADGLWAFAGTVAAFALLFLLGALATVLGVEPTENQVIQFVGEDPTMVLLMIAIVFLFNAPAEEFLFRNVIQKRLYAAFTRPGAIVVTSSIFALVHVPVFALDPSGGLAAPGAVAISVGVIFSGSLAFGYVYARTDNLAVPIGAHALFNAIQFGLLYLELVIEDVPAVALLAG